MRKTMMILLSLSLATAACKKKEASCGDIVDHTMSLMPEELRANIKKDDAVAKCEKLSPESRQCAADAKTLDDLMKCPKK